MAVDAPTPKAALEEAKKNYMKWGSFLFQLLGSNTFRPALTAATETEVVTIVKTYKSYTPKDSLEPMAINVLYDPATWDLLRAAKEAGTKQLLETSDGFAEIAIISEMGSVDGDIDGPITDMPITFAFPGDKSAE